MKVLINKLRKVGFSKSILFILGLVFSYKLLEDALLNILITHLSTDELRKDVVVVNLLEGTGAVLQIFFAFLADAYTGRFTMLALSTTFSVLGLLLSCLASAQEEDGGFDTKLLYPALLLMVVSQSAKEVTLKAFLGDQLLPIDRQASEEEQASATKSSDFWWEFVSFPATIVALFVVPNDHSLWDLSIVLSSIMGGYLLWFFIGTGFYNFCKPTGSSLSDIPIVIHRAVVVKKLRQGQQYYHLAAVESIPPDVSWLRWLDRAAAVDDPLIACSVEQVKGVKFFMKMLPMSLTFLTFCLVYTSGRTFFLEEAESMTGKNFPILLFIILPKLIESAVSAACIFLLKKLLCFNSSTQRMKLLRIGIGMMCCVPCCIVAWFNNAKYDGNVHNYMILLRLFPQFFLLELMRRLSIEGLMHYFESQVSESISKYGPPFGECVMGIGKFVSVAFIISLSKGFGWFGDTVSLSHLDRYYLFLVGLSSVNFIAYCFVARWYGEDTFLLGEEEDEEMAISGATLMMREDGNSTHTQQEEMAILVEVKTTHDTAVQNGDGLKEEEEEAFINDPAKQDSSSPANATVLMVVRGVSFPGVNSRGTLHKRFNSFR